VNGAGHVENLSSTDSKERASISASEDATMTYRFDPSRVFLRKVLVEASDVGAPAAPDPVVLAVLAIQSLAPASLRASATGVGARVAVPDETTAAVFRAALARTSHARPTDRLLQIVVENTEMSRRLHRGVTRLR
jgi:hypothetical protein